MFDLTDRTALVTGATGGIGAAIARAMHAKGAVVAISGRRGDMLDALAGQLGGRVHVIACDIASKEEVEGLVPAAETAMGHVDILVNNAGVTVPGLVTDQSVEDLDTVLDTNLRAPLLMAREAGRRMIARGAGGRIINIGSIGTFRVLPGSTAYCIAKAAIGMMTQCLAHEWARHDITVNALCPGFIETELNDTWFRSDKGQAQIRSFLKRRLQKERDLDGMLLLLASDASRAITGSLLTVDDGQSL
jgi:NAD(P)-dependent dehydrogenase (short-subunit alcohol dehydrogenase family)